MSSRRASQRSGVGRTIRKFLVSGFVLSTYAAYALHERFGSPMNNVSAAIAPVPNTSATQAEPAIAQADPAASPTAAQPQVGQPQAAQPQSGQVAGQAAQGKPSSQAVRSAAAPMPTPTAVSALGPYKDGTYTGVKANAFYGTVQVKVVIKSGKITSVQFLDYPQDRRTSQRINSIATPYLQTEAIQAQSANVDVISGATLTSQAFMASLQSALDAAHN